jgi:hypothetical protein
LEENLPVMVVTTVPVDGWLPWTHFDQNNQLIWEKDHWGDYSRGLERLAEAQRALVEGYAAEGKSAYLVDAWRIYVDHPDTDWMYLDVMHPGSAGAALIAEEWLRVFERTGLWVKVRET